MASIEMKNLRSFPMEKLCFDLKLEVVEQMKLRDVVELTKVNQGFQGMLVRRPWIVFGEHVDCIQFEREEIRINKFSNSNAMKLNFDRPFFHFAFVKKIRSCELLLFWKPYQFNEEFEERTTLLKNLKSVNRLDLISTSKETLERFFSNFHASIKKDAFLRIDSSAFNDQVIKDRIENFMVGPQLKDCEKIWFECHTEDSVRFCYNALSKAEIKNVAMIIKSSRCIDLLIQQIITKGIPSKNPEAAFLLESDVFKSSGWKMDPSQYSGVRRIDGENRHRLLKKANDLVMNFEYADFDCFGEESSIFRRRFDSTKDCIYMYYDDDDVDTNCFLAFYVPID